MSIAPAVSCPLVQEGFAASLTEAAVRFALSHPAMGTILVGMATPQQFEDALAAVAERPVAAGGARPSDNAAAGIRRGGAMISGERLNLFG